MGQQIELVLAQVIKFFALENVGACSQGIVVDGEDDVIERTLDCFLVHNSGVVLEASGEGIGIAGRGDVNVAVIQDLLRRAQASVRSGFWLWSFVSTRCGAWSGRRCA